MIFRCGCVLWYEDEWAENMVAKMGLTACFYLLISLCMIIASGSVLRQYREERGDRSGDLSVLTGINFFLFIWNICGFIVVYGVSRWGWRVE